MRVDETFYTGEQLCERFPHLTPAGLANMRYRGVGPRGVKVGRRIYYPESAVMEWLERRADDPKSA
jgi:hypothetical protein